MKTHQCLLIISIIRCLTSASNKTRTIKRSSPNHLLDSTPHIPTFTERKRQRRYGRREWAMFDDYESSGDETTRSTMAETRWRGKYVSAASWVTPYPLGSSNEWHSMHRNPNKEYNHQWYEWIYSTEESNPQYSYSFYRTSAVWLKIRNTRRTPEPLEIRRFYLRRNRTRFEKQKRAKAHAEWKARNAHVPIVDEDYARMVRRVFCDNSMAKCNVSTSTARFTSFHGQRDVAVDSVDQEVPSSNLSGFELFWTQNFVSSNGSDEEVGY